MTSGTGYEDRRNDLIRNKQQALHRNSHDRGHSADKVDKNHKKEANKRKVWVHAQPPYTALPNSSSEPLELSTWTLSQSHLSWLPRPDCDLVSRWRCRRYNLQRRSTPTRLDWACPSRYRCTWIKSSEVSVQMQWRARCHRLSRCFAVLTLKLNGLKLRRSRRWTGRYTARRLSQWSRNGMKGNATPGP